MAVKLPVAEAFALIVTVKPSSETATMVVFAGMFVPVIPFALAASPCVNTPEVEVVRVGEPLVLVTVTV